MALDLQLRNHQPPPVGNTEQIDLADAGVRLPSLQRHLVVEQAEPTARGARPMPPEVEERDREVLLEPIAGRSRSRRPLVHDEIWLASRRASWRGFAQRRVFSAERRRGNRGAGVVKPARRPAPTE